LAETNWQALVGARNFDEAVADLLQALIDRKSKITNLNTGGVFRTQMELAAQGIADLGALLVATVPQGFALSASGEWLDLQAAELGLSRKPEIQTRGKVVFVRRPGASGNLKIPKGTILRTPTSRDGLELRYLTDGDVILPGDHQSVEAPVTAEHPGALYNVGSGYITEIVTTVTGIASVTNQPGWIVTEGADVEADESLRVRCVLRWHEISQGSTKYAYRSWALSVPGVRDAVILDQHPRGQGTVDVVLLGTDGAPSAGLIEQVRVLIEAKRPICSDVLVRGPVTKASDLAVTVQVHPERGELEAVRGDALGALGALFQADPLYPAVKPLTLGEDMTRARIISTLMGVENVVNVVVTIPAEDLVVAADELAVRGVVSVTAERVGAL